VQGERIVSRLLRDDLEGSRHQRFILKLAGNQSILIAHNIDLAPKIDTLKKGDPVKFYGEYEWNNRVRTGFSPGPPHSTPHAGPHGALPSR